MKQEFWQFRLGVKLSFYAIILIAILSGITYWNASTRESELIREGFRRRTRAIAFVLGSTVLNDLLRNDLADVQQALKTIVAEDPDIVSASVLQREGGGLVPAAVNSSLPIHMVVESLTEPLYLPGSRTEYALLRIDFRRDALDETLAGSRRANALFFLGATSLAVLVSIWLSTLVSRPVRQLVAAARRLRDGDDEARVEIRTSDEFSEIGEAFNEMAVAVGKKDRWLQHLLDDQRRIQSLSIQINTQLERGPLFETLYRIWSEAARVRHVAIFLWDEEKERLIEATRGFALKSGEGISGKAFARRELRGYDDLGDTDDFVVLPGENPEEWESRAILAIPLFFYNKATGVIRIANRTNGKPFYENEQSVYQILASQTASAIENSRLFEASTTDAMTGLFLRRYFDIRLDRRLRAGQATAVLMIDVDHFKSINDTLGHPFGDRVLTTVTKTFLEGLRPGEMAARYGGEEFTVLLIDRDLAQARGVAEEIRARVEALAMKRRGDEEPVKITISIGVVVPQEGEGVRELIARADEALYRAKGNGRNRVEG
jgi:diguanylate cyclase (GGDEF)-like protein